MSPLLARALLSALAGLGLASPALSAQPDPAHLVVEAPRGYRLSPPVITAAPEGVRIHGSICRIARLAPGPMELRAERLDSQARLRDSAPLRPVVALSAQRGRGCSFYDLRTSWLLSEGDTIRVVGGA